MKLRNIVVLTTLTSLLAYSCASTSEIRPKPKKAEPIYEYVKSQDYIKKPDYEKAKKACEKLLEDYINAESNLKAITSKAYDWQELVTLQMRINQRDQLIKEGKALPTREDDTLVKRRDDIRDRFRAEGEPIWGGKPTVYWWAIKAREAQSTLDKAINAYINANQALINSYKNLIKILE